MKLVGLLPSLLPKAGKYARDPVSRFVYWKLYDFWSNMHGDPVPFTLHGFPVRLNRGNTYPFFLECLSFNAPLVELVTQARAALGRPITMVDVGASLGDTVLLLKERCPGAVRQFICIEGDEEFYQLLRSNTEQFDDVKAVKTMLAGTRVTVRETVKHHGGSAMAIGESMTQALPLDEISEISQTTCDVLKIDIDGFDGEALAGARETLKRSSPAVIFEWHPALIAKTGNNPFVGFQTLAECGYDSYLWFANTGVFSHFSGTPTIGHLKQTNDYLLAVNHRQDAHFDVIALPRSSPIDQTKVAALESLYRGKRHPSRA